MIKSPLSPHKAKLSWVEGLLLFHMGISRLAVRRLHKARRGLLSLAEARDYAMVSLDLARILRLDDEPEAEKDVIAETGRELRRLGQEESPLSALAPSPRSTLSMDAMERRKLDLLEPQLRRRWLWLG